MKKIKTIFVIGPTASGKTQLAVKLAEQFSGEIISADSRQVYRRMDIGTGKDLGEYRNIRYHLIDIVKPSEEYNLARFRKDAIGAIQDIDERAKVPIICGGSAMYIDCLLSKYDLPGTDYDPQERKRLKSLEINELLEILGEELPPDEAANKNRIVRRIERKFSANKIAEAFPFKLDPLIIGVLRNRPEIHARIEKRLKKRINEGMIEEVKYLHDSGISWEKLEFFGLEYKFVSAYLRGIITKEELFTRLLAKIRNFARRQDVWFRKLERQGNLIYWIRDAAPDEASNLVEKFLRSEPLPMPQVKLSEINYGKKNLNIEKMHK